MMRGTTIVPALQPRYVGTARVGLGQVTEERRKEAREDLRAALQLAMEERSRREARQAQEDVLKKAIEASERAGEGRQAILETGTANLDTVIHNTTRIAIGAFILYGAVTLLTRPKRVKPATPRANPTQRDAMIAAATVADVPALRRVARRARARVPMAWGPKAKRKWRSIARLNDDVAAAVERRGA